MSFGPDRRRKPGRRPAFRKPRNKILVVCEGANTEPQYIKQFASVHRDTIVEVDIAPKSGISPLTVVRVAKRLKDQAARASKRESDPYLKYDSVWCVFDFDVHPDVSEALEMAKRNGIKVAMSNPCFELWLVLHLREAPGMIHRHRVQSMLRKLVTGYDKQVDFEVYRDGYEKAVDRAMRLDELAESVGEPGKNPSTGVYKLTRTIAPPPRAPSRRGAGR